jgi:hypothetical protein
VFYKQNNISGPDLYFSEELVSSLEGTTSDLMFLFCLCISMQCCVDLQFSLYKQFNIEYLVAVYDMFSKLLLTAPLSRHPFARGTQQQHQYGWNRVVS